MYGYIDSNGNKHLLGFIPVTEADEINFDNSNTDLQSTDVQGAIEELTSAENIAYDSNNSVKDMIDTLSDIRSLTMTPSQGVTNNSTAKVVGNLILLSIDVTYSSSGSGWAPAFDIPNVSKTVIGTFSVVTDTEGTEIKSLQAYWDNNTIIVRVRNPLAKQYRGQAILSFS